MQRTARNLCRTHARRSSQWSSLQQKLNENTFLSFEARDTWCPIFGMASMVVLGFGVCTEWTIPLHGWLVNGCLERPKGNQDPTTAIYAQWYKFVKKKKTKPCLSRSLSLFLGTLFIPKWKPTKKSKYSNDPHSPYFLDFFSHLPYMINLHKHLGLLMWLMWN